MKKKTIGGWFIDNNVSDLKKSRDALDEQLFTKEKILVNNLIHQLSICAGTNKPITDGCNINNDNNDAINYLYLNKSIGGRKKNMNAINNNKMLGGCFTCSKSKKKLSMFSKTFIIIIPSLYKKYKNNDKMGFDKYIKTIKEENKMKDKKNKIKNKKGGTNVDYYDLDEDNNQMKDGSLFILGDLLSKNNDENPISINFDAQLQSLRSSI